MSRIDVRIVNLKPLHAVSVHAFGASPEDEAWNKLMAWAKPKGLLENPAAHRIFGFNNPSPAEGSPNYGYEFWMEVEPGTQADGTVKTVDFPGGLYAVTRMKGGGKDIPEHWKQLGVWCENSKYRLAHHQWLEEHISGTDTPDSLELDLYLPIAE
jgi:DNA gyrase inhibitor GyrI